MITFQVKSSHAKLKKAASSVPEFFAQLRLGDLPGEFNHTTHTASEVLERIERTCLSASLEITVDTYRPKWPWSKAIGHARGSNIFINKNKLDSLSAGQYVGNFAHETMHLLGYKHKGNRKTAYNLKTVPYVIGDLAQSWFEARAPGF